MNLVKCRNGHFYDSDKYKDCPLCHPEIYPIEKDYSYKRRVRCRKGHIFDGDNYLQCPYCKRDYVIEYGLDRIDSWGGFYSKCSHGHFYNAYRSNKCSFCENIKKSPDNPVRITKCINNHFYNSMKYSICPHCLLLETEGAMASGLKFAKCNIGHYYNSNVFYKCPYCYPITGIGTKMFNRLCNFSVKNFDAQLLDEKGLIENNSFNEKFCNAYYMYYKLFMSFLTNEYKLDDLDRAIGNLSVPIKEKENRMLLNHMFSPHKYIFIDNVLHIERLSPSFLESLVDKFQNNDMSFGGDIGSIIRYTFPLVIKEKEYVKLRIGITYDFNDERVYDYVYLNDKSISIDELLEINRDKLGEACIYLFDYEEEDNIVFSLYDYGYDFNTMTKIKELLE